MNETFHPLGDVLGMPLCYAGVGEERNLLFPTPEQTSERAHAVLAQFLADNHPHLAELTMKYVLQPGYDSGKEYEFGVDLILDGLEKHLRSGKSLAGMTV